MFFEAIDMMPAHAPAAQHAEIRVLTYNVRGLPWPVALGRGAALRRIGEALAQMRREGRQPDVVLIQEGFRGEMTELVKASGYPHWVRGPRRDGGFGKLTSGGLHVLSDIPITAVRAAAFSDCAGLDCLANKGVMLVRLAPPGRPFQIDVVNTHLNSKRASRAPAAQALAAHNRQTDALIAFVNANRDAGLPLLVGGDFNVKNAPQRYYHDALERPYTVVSEFCSRAGSDCGGGGPDAAQEPWLRSQDLQAFADDGGVDVEPVAVESLFGAPDPRDRLSDHDGYLVRYRLSWSGVTAATADGPAVELKKARFGAWGVKVSWKR
jgi:endonuclease/exonuclease/phosphatase family metal-dependent hydrolase